MWISFNDVIDIDFLMIFKIMECTLIVKIIFKFNLMM